MLYTLYFTQTLKRCSPITGYQNCTVDSILQVWPPPHVDAVWGGHDCLHDWSGRVSTAGAQRLANRARQQTPVLHTARTAAGLRGMYLVYYETISLSLHTQVLYFPYYKYKLGVMYERQTQDRRSRPGRQHF
jgi:hypothetical protein